jgi:hypothetical protein
MANTDNWRSDPAVVAARVAFAEAEAAVTSLEQELRGLATELLAAERAEAEARLGLGESTNLSDIIAASERVAGIRRRVETAQEAAQRAYPAYTTSRAALLAAEKAARAAVWPEALAGYLHVVDVLSERLADAVAAEGAVRDAYQRLVADHPGRDGFAASPDGRAVGNASYGTRRLRPESLADWRTWRAQAGAVPDADWRRAEAERLAAEARRLEADAEREGKLAELREQAADEQRWSSTMQLSPSRLVKVAMRGVASTIKRTA